MNVIFYCYSIEGLGHYLRTRAIANAVTELGGKCLICYGGLPLKGALASEPGTVLLKTSSASDLEQISIENATKVLDLIHYFRPKWFVAEHFPFGRFFLRRELLPILSRLDYLRKKKLIQVASSSRDIVDGAAPSPISKATLAAATLFDKFFIHSDANHIKHKYHAEFLEKIQYSGYVVPGSRSDPDLINALQNFKGEFKLVTVHGGSGQQCRQVYSTLGAIIQRLARRNALRFAIVQGSKLNVFTHDPNIKLLGFVDNMEEILSISDLFISTCGYNAFAAAMATNANAIMIPSEHSFFEQNTRAQHFADLGFFKCCSIKDISEETILRASNGQRRSLSDIVDLNGAVTTAQHLLRDAEI
jgi:predicted glycosyltransferase